MKSKGKSKGKDQFSSELRNAGATAVPKRHKDLKALPQAFKVLYPNAAGIDVGGSEHWVCVPSDRDEQPVQRFGSCTRDLVALADWLTQCGITHVALEATGVYWIALFEYLEQRGFQVMLVNGQQTHRPRARKSDVRDCQWIQQMMTYGLLSGSFRPADQFCAVRAIVRLRHRLLEDCARAGQHMDKALVQMNVHLGRVLSDLTGVSGLSILRAIVGGERSPTVLADLCHPNVKATHETIARQLEGTWRKEHLLELELALQSYDHLQQQVARCDTQIQTEIAALQCTGEPLPPTRCPSQSRKQRKREAHAALRTALYQAMGVDLTAIPTIDVDTALVIFTEIGPDLSCFPTEQHFCSWLTLAPDTRISGGKRIRGAPNPAINRVGETLKQAAVNARNSQSFIGAAHRGRLRRMPPCCAVKATAHQVARIVYAILSQKKPYVERGIEAYETHQREQQLRQLHRKAHRLGVKIVPITE